MRNNLRKRKNENERGGEQMKDRYIDIEIDLGLTELENNIQELVDLHEKIKRKAAQVQGFGENRKVKITIK